METEILQLDELKRIEFELLVELDRICGKYGLKYSLAYGTLLGAVRHHGFIPWDDDIDVMMSRPDYYKFLEAVEKECADSPYKVVSMHTDDDFFAPLAKFTDTRTRVYQTYGQIEKVPYGVYVDLFILDGLPEKGKEEHYKEAEKLRFKWGMACRKIFAKHRSKSFLRDVGGSLYSIPYKILGYKHYRNKYDRHCSSVDYNTAKNIAVVEFGENLKKEMMDKADMEELSTVEFEGRAFSAVRSPEEYLTRMYGDYMQLPPESQRVPKHSSKVVRIE